jgi:hypothetical protein
MKLSEDARRIRNDFKHYLRRIWSISNQENDSKANNSDFLFAGKLDHSIINDWSKPLETSGRNSGHISGSYNTYRGRRFGK